MSEPVKTLGLIHGAKAIGAILGKSPRETFYLLERGHIEGAKKLGAQWCVPESKLRQQFGLEVSEL
jgi:hypothetical protein